MLSILPQSHVSWYPSNLSEQSGPVSSYEASFHSKPVHVNMGRPCKKMHLFSVCLYNESLTCVSDLIALVCKYLN